MSNIFPHCYNSGHLKWNIRKLNYEEQEALVSLCNPLTLFQNKRVQEISVKHHGMVWDLAAMDGAEHRLRINSGFIKG